MFKNKWFLVILLFTASIIYWIILYQFINDVDEVLTEFQECIAGGQSIHCPKDETR